VEGAISARSRFVLDPAITVIILLDCHGAPDTGSWPSHATMSHQQPWWLLELLACQEDA
jgi:hypothetical protein